MDVNSPEEWSRILTSANEHDGFAIDTLIKGKLNGVLSDEADYEFEQRCFLSWIKDGNFDGDMEELCKLQTFAESTEERDDNASRLDVRFVDPRSMARFIGIGLEGDFEVSITYHPNSEKPTRVYLRELERVSDADLQARVDSWEDRGYKQCREWMPRPSSSKRAASSSLKSLSDLISPLKGRVVTYWIQFASVEVPFKSSRIAGSKETLADLTLRMSLREPAADGTDTDGLMKISVLSTVTPLQVGAFESFSVVSKIEIRGAQNMCKFVDGRIDQASAEARTADYCNGKHGDSSFDCGRTDMFSTRDREGSDLSVDTFWMVSARSMKSLQVKSQHILEDVKVDETGGLKEILSKDPLASEVGSMKVLRAWRVETIKIMTDLLFMDYLRKACISSRIRNSNTSWKERKEDERVGLIDQYVNNVHQLY